MGVIVSVLAFILLAVPVSAGQQIHFLDVVGAPYLPGEMQRHVQVIYSTSAVTTPWIGEGVVQHAARFTLAEAQDLADAINSWANGTPPEVPPTIWQRQSSAGGTTFWFTVYTLPAGQGISSGPRCEIQLTAMAAIIEDDFCPACSLAQVYSRQEMVLTLAEAQALVLGLTTWVDGGSNYLIWHKTVTQ